MDNTDAILPAKTEKHPGKPVWGPWATLGFGLAVIGAQIVTEILVAFVLAIGYVVSDNKINPSQLFENLTTGLVFAVSTIVSAIICVGLIIIIIKAKGGFAVAEYLGLKRIDKKTILFLLAITLGFAILSDSLTLILGKPISSEFVVNVYKTSIWPPLLWLAMIIFAPAFEEIFFRGFLFEGFRNSRMGSAVTIILLALTWSLLHIQYGIYEIATIFILGILLGIVRLRTGSLWSAIVMHTFINLLSTLEVAIYTNRFLS